MAGGKGPKIQALSAGLRNVRGRVDEESARLGVMVTQSASTAQSGLEGQEQALRASLRELGAALEQEVAALQVSTRVPAPTLANPIARRPNIGESHSETPEHRRIP